MNIAPLLSSISPAIFDLPAIALDVETTNLDYGDPLNADNSLVLSSFFFEGRGMFTFIGDEYNLPNNLIPLLEGEVVLVGHNIKFDIQWLVRCGLDLTKVMVWDTMIAEKVLLGNNPNFLSLSLDEVAGRYGLGHKGSVVSKMIKADVCPSKISERLLKNYCEQDVDLSYQVFLLQRELLKEQNKIQVMLTRSLLTPCLADIEKNGMELDPVRVMKEWTQAVEELSELDAELEKIADINWNSSPQKAALLYDDFKFKELTNPRTNQPIRTDKDNKKSDVDTILALKCTTKRQAKLQGLMAARSKVYAKLSKNLNSYKDCIDNKDVMQAEFRQEVAKTHRLTSTGRKYKSQFQNIPRIFKSLFTSPQEGWEICECDGAGLEFRIAVELSQDEQGQADLANPNFDPHTNTANIIGVSRQDAKEHTFKPLYGGESGTELEQKYYKSFRDRYPGINRMQEAWMREALENKSVVLPWGMEFFFPHTKIQKSGYQTFKTNICNYPVQSFATAEVIPIAIVHLWHKIKERGLQCLLVNTVHDSVILIAPVEEKEELNEILVDSFTTLCYNYVHNVYGMNFTTPLGVEIKWGKHWGEGEAFTRDVENTLTFEEDTNAN